MKFSHRARIYLLILIIILKGPLVFSESTSKSEAEFTLLKTELAKSPTKISIKAKLAQLYFQKYQYSEVVQLLKSDSELLPRSSLIILAKSYGEIQDRPNQGRILEHLITLNQNDYESMTLLGEYFITIKQDEDAIKNLRQALNLKPGYKIALEDLLLIYQSKNNNFEMRIIYQDLIKHYGNRPEYISKLCRIHTLDGFYDTAKKYCKGGINIDPKNPENYLFLAYIEQSLGNINQSRQIVKTAIQRFPESNIVLASYATILIRQKDFAGAEKYFLQAAKINSESFDSQIGLAISSFESKDYDIALNAYKNACKIEPHKTTRELKRAANFIRYKSMEKWEDAFTEAFDQCIRPDANSNKKKKFVSLEELRKPKPFSPFTVPLVMDVKIAADPANLKKPDGSTIFRGQDTSSTGSNNNGTFTSSSFAPSASPFSKNGGGAGHNNDSTSTTIQQPSGVQQQTQPLVTQQQQSAPPAQSSPQTAAPLTPLEN
jgi:Tfp pilus assembly protein PilF